MVPDRPTKSISAEDTFEQDVVLAETEPMIRRLAEKAWLASRKESRTAKTVILKLKTAEFRVLTRSQTPPSPPSSCEELIRIALSLREGSVSMPSKDSVSWASGLAISATPMTAQNYRSSPLRFCYSPFAPARNVVKKAIEV